MFIMKFTKYLFIIGILLFVFIIWNTGLSEIANSLRSFNLFFACLVMATMLIVIFLKTLKQNVLLTIFDAKISLYDGAKIWLIGYFLSVITPGKSGDFLRTPYLADKTKKSVDNCFVVVTIERILDVAYLFIAGIFGLILFSSYFGLGLDSILTLISVFILFIVMLFIFTNKKYTELFARPLFYFFVHDKFKSKLKLGFNAFYNSLEIAKKNKKKLSYAFVLTVISWFVVILQYYLIARGLNLEFSYFFLLLIMPIVLLVEALPISISGIGTRDVALIFFLAFENILAPAAISFSISILVANYVMAFCGMLFLKQFKS